MYPAHINTFVIINIKIGIYYVRISNRVTLVLGVRYVFSLRFSFFKILKRRARARAHFPVSM